MSEHFVKDRDLTINEYEQVVEVWTKSPPQGKGPVVAVFMNYTKEERLKQAQDFVDYMNKRNEI